MKPNIWRRLVVLEARNHARDMCRRCFNYPVRMTSHAEATGALISETLPPDGCPDCGRPIKHTRPYVGINPAKV
jgi:hypothetical protein